MRQILLFILFFWVYNSVSAQLITTNPSFLRESSTNVEIIMDANYGNKAMVNYPQPTDIYVHIGVITNKSTNFTDWKYVKFTWGTTNAAAQCTSLGNGKWKYTITQDLRSFFNITDPTETIQKVSILFRNGLGVVVQRNADGSDLYIPVYPAGLQVRIDQPYANPLMWRHLSLLQKLWVTR